MRANVLITSVSIKVPLIQAVKRTVNKIYTKRKKVDNGQSEQMLVIGADVNPHCIGRYFVDEFWVMPHLKDLDIQDMISYCHKNWISTIIPTRDGELLYFAQYKDKLQQVGIHVMVSDATSVEICLDKLLFYEKASQLGYPVIPTSSKLADLIRQMENAEGGLEVSCVRKTDSGGKHYVVKERYGAGSKGLGIRLKKEEAEQFSKGLANPIFQPFISGKEVSVDMYVTRKNEVKGVILRSRNVVVDGESQITETFQNPELTSLCASFAQDLHLYGHVMLQLIIDEHENIYFIESNSRFGGASTLSLEMGLDSVYWFLLESKNIDLNEFPFQRADQEKKLIRYKQDLIL